MKRFLNLSKTATTMCRVLGGIFLVLLIAGELVTALVFPFEGALPYALGLLAGSLLSAYKVVLMEKSLSRSLDMEGKTAQNYYGLQAILRYVLTIAVMLGVVFLPKVLGVFGVVLGILSLQIAAYITGALMKNENAEI